MLLDHELPVWVMDHPFTQPSLEHPVQQFNYVAAYLPVLLHISIIASSQTTVDFRAGIAIVGSNVELQV